MCQRSAQVIDSHDDTKAARWMNATRQTMSVLDQARVSADIAFAADSEKIDFDSEL